MFAKSFVSLLTLVAAVTALPGPSKRSVTCSNGHTASNEAVSSVFHTQGVTLTRLGPP